MVYISWVWAPLPVNNGIFEGFIGIPGDHWYPGKRCKKHQSPSEMEISANRGIHEESDSRGLQNRTNTLPPKRWVYE